MRTKSPFLTGFPTLLFGSSKYPAQEVLRVEREKLRAGSLGEISGQLSGEIPPEVVCGHASTTRNRIFSHEVTFWAFLSQILSEDGSCARAVALVQQWFQQRKLPVPSANTSSYSEARRRLPEDMLCGIHRDILLQLDRNTSGCDRWRGHRVKAIDGTSAQMPDTAANQEAYPQPPGQEPGCGFPVVQLVGLIDLIHGGWEDFVESDTRAGETRGLDRLLTNIGDGDILVADRAYVSYEVTARLKGRGAHFVGRNHHSRKVDFRKGKWIGHDERLQVWRKPHWQTPGSCVDDGQWQQLPGEIEMRIIRVRWGGRDGRRFKKYIVTTLLDPVKYPAGEVASLYFHRWEIELRFRDIKTTMGMDMLRTKSPEMIRKETMMHMIAYNAIRLLILRSAKVHGCNHRRVSFKGALQVLATSASSFAQARGGPARLRRKRDKLMGQIAQRIVPDRPGRNEPRRVKRRPKSSRWLQKPRREYREHFQCDISPIKILDQSP
jgi:hypothetical protein